MITHKIWQAITAGVVILLAGCGKTDKTIQGYLEADMVYAAPISAGRIEKIHIERGALIKKGTLMFEQEDTEYTAAVAAAEAVLQKSRSDLQDLLKGARTEEIEALKAKISRIEAVCKLSKLEDERTRTLYERQAVSTREFDNARLFHERNVHDLSEAKYNLSVAMLPARPDRLKMAEEAIKSADNDLTAARWRLAQRKIYTPADAIVFDVLLRTGEVATPGMSIAALIPLDNLKVRFFVSADRLPQIKFGDKVILQLNNQGQSCPATINYVASRPEYTPPIIYSRENSGKLVFMVEATIDRNHVAGLHPGMPVRVLMAKDDKP